MIELVWKKNSTRVTTVCMALVGILFVQFNVIKPNVMKSRKKIQKSEPVHKTRYEESKQSKQSVTVKRYGKKGMRDGEAEEIEIEEGEYKDENPDERD